MSLFQQSSFSIPNLYLLPGKQLLYNYPSAYDWNIPESFKTKFSDFVKVSKKESIQNPPWNNTVLLTSLDGQSFTSFAKATQFNHDLYWYLVAPSLEDDLYVETWMHTTSMLPSFCNGSYHVENVQLLGFQNVPEYKETVDHSKWAISKNKKWVCIGDINRTGSQYVRGGGTVCSLLPTPWQQYNTAIQQIEKCPTSVSGSST
ncbi:deoxyribonuclease-2-alpha-like [Lytechinus pictus]|uniref:deoxyribonuclease-2-alpha-like n=1 Tax=Lytechinus pictus TaxID=7653 RepID=UPI0030B9C899